METDDAVSSRQRLSEIAEKLENISERLNMIAEVVRTVNRMSGDFNSFVVRMFEHQVLLGESLQHVIKAVSERDNLVDQHIVSRELEISAAFLARADDAAAKATAQFGQREEAEGRLE